jgi:hypothetical protein
MTYAFTYDVPIDSDTYWRITKGIGRELPKGMICHIAHRIENGLRYVDVWESKDAWDAFQDERLHPVVHPMLESMLGFVPPEPEATELDVVDVWTAEHISAS